MQPVFLCHNNHHRPLRLAILLAACASAFGAGAAPGDTESAENQVNRLDRPAIYTGKPEKSAEACAQAIAKQLPEFTLRGKWCWNHGASDGLGSNTMEELCRYKPASVTEDANGYSAIFHIEEQGPNPSNRPGFTHAFSEKPTYNIACKIEKNRGYPILINLGECLEACED